MNYNYTFSSATTDITGYYTPLTIKFRPDLIPLVGTQFLSKIIYQLPDQTITKVNTFVSSGYGVNDCRSPFNYILPTIGPTTQTMSISAYIGPNGFSPTVYTINFTPLLPKFTRNPLASAENYAFGEVHLVKMKAWGPNTSQIIVLETNNPNYLLLNYNGL